MSRRTYSLQRRLLLTLLASIALAWLATAVFSYFDAVHELDELLDAHLAQSAALLVTQAAHEVDEIDTDHTPQLYKHAQRVAFQIWEHGTSLRLHSASVPGTRMSAQDEGFSNAVIAGKPWRIFSAWDDEHRYLIQVGERYAARNEIAVSIVKNLLVPLLFALPLLALLVWINVARALRPLAALGRQVAQREPGNLLRLDAGEIPAEVLPLVNNLNQLFERVAGLIQSERRFTADASHELRTPLAALKTQAQVARASSNDAERAHALDHVILGCDRATHLLQQLLTLARLDPEQPGGDKVRFNLRDLAKSSIADMAPFALSKNIEISLSDGSAIDILGYPGLVAIMLRNLIDNAIRYSPAGGNVCVHAASDGQAATVSVSDDGPGIAPEERSKVGQRFYRILGSGESGSGLGLSIVNRIAELHGATLALEDGRNGKGLSVEVTFEL